MRRPFPTALAISLLAPGCFAGHGADDAGGDVDGGPPADATIESDGGDVRDADAGDSAPPPDPIDDDLYAFCVQWRTVFCEANARCCTRAIRRLGDDQCLPESLDLICTYRADDPALRDGSLSWNEEAARRYLSELEARAPDCSQGPGFPFPIFRNFLVGSLTLGEDCTPARLGNIDVGRFRCDVGLRCELEGTTASFVGTCAPLGREGNSCNGQFEECIPGYFCDSRPVTGDVPYGGVCTSRSADGSDCIWDSACLSGFCYRTCTMPAPSDSWCDANG